MYFVLKRLVWLAVLSCLIPRTSAGSDCEVATAASSGTCAAVGTVASVLAIKLCFASLGLGCGVAAGVIAATGACGIVAGNIDCDSGSSDAQYQNLLDKLNQNQNELRDNLNVITKYLGDIEDTVDTINANIDIGFFEAKYNEYINKIRQATKRYQLNVIQKSTDANGLIENNILVGEWAEDVLGDCDYNVRGALDVIEGMITGTQGITRSPTVYELAKEHNLCTEDLYEFVTSLILEGTTVAFIALNMRGDGVHQLDKDQLKERLRINHEKYIMGCYWHPKVKGTYKGTKIPTDLNTTPLYLKTSSVLGSRESVGVEFYDDEQKYDERAGGINLKFDTQIIYNLPFCIKSSTPLPVTPPTSQHKIWKISLTAGPRVVIECNGVQVLNVVLDNSVCDSIYWSTWWSRKVSSIKFSYWDTAKDASYCIGNNCA